MKKLNTCLKWCQRALIFFVLIIVVITGVEVGFRIYLRITKKEVITILSKQEIFEKAWFEPHPHLLYVFKPNNSFVMNAFKRGQFTTNKFGFRSTLEFDVKTVSKPVNTLRIATLGGSTTMGVNNNNEIWPYLIGKNLQEHVHDRKIEVLNEGIMGYTSLDNLLDLSMRVVDYKCDIYIIYLGINDLLSIAPLNIYRTDNAHFRTTLHENLSYASLFPSWLLKLKSFRAILQMLGIPDSRNLIANTGTNQFRKHFQVPQEEMQSVTQVIRQTFIRNIISMIGIIHSHNPKAVIILSSFFDLDNRNVIPELNQDLSMLANKYNAIFTDAANTVPRVREMVYDYNHFTPEGDRIMGELFSHAILNNLSSE